MVKLTLEEKVEKLKEEAEAKGLLDNMLYTSLLDDFYYQTDLMNRLKAEIDNVGVMVQKVYVKNNPTQVPNQLIASYNATSNARVNTVSAIAKVVKTFNELAKDDDDPLLKIMNGGGEK